MVAGHLLDLLPAGRRVARARVVRGRRVLGLLLLLLLVGTGGGASRLIHLGLRPRSLKVFCFPPPAMVRTFLFALSLGNIIKGNERMNMVMKGDP